MSVRQKLVSGVLYTSIAKYTGILVTLVVTGVLSRLFGPDDFADIAVVTVLIAFFNIFSDIGIAPAIIQHKQLSRDDLGHIFSFTCWTGLAVTLLFFATTGLIGRYYGSDTITDISRVLSVCLLFSALNIVPNGLLYREKRFRFIAIRSLAVQTVGGAAAITAAYSGAGIYALTINPIFTSILLFAVNFRENPLPFKLIPSREALRKVFNFSAFQFLFNIINYFTRNLDKLLMRRYMDQSALGYYDKSYRLMMLPLQNITYVLSPVMHPIFSDLQNDLQKMAASYLKVVRFLAFIGLPLSAVLFFTGGELIRIIFGDQWGASVPAFRILSLSVGLQIILSTSGPIFQAANSTKTLFVSGLLSAILTVTAILIGIFGFHTTEAVAAGVCASFAVNFVQSFYLLYKYALRLPAAPFWRSFLSPLAVTALVAAALWATDALMPPTGAILSLAVKGIAAALVWFAYIQLTGTLDIVGKIREKLRK